MMPKTDQGGHVMDGSGSNLLQMHGYTRAAFNSLMCGLCRVRGPRAEAPEPAGQDAYDDTWCQQGDWRCCWPSSQANPRRLQEAGCRWLMRSMETTPCSKLQREREDTAASHITS